MVNKTQINYAIIIFSLIVIYGIHIYAFKKGFPTCDNYVTNTYLYLALSICYVYLNVTKLKRYNNVGFPAFLLGIGLLLYMSFHFPKTKEGVLFNHLLWFGFLTCLSLMILPLINISTSEAIYLALAITFLIFMLMSVIVYIFPKFFEETFHFVYPGLFVALLMIILIELYYLFIAGKYPKSAFRYISYAVIVLFSVYISYDTQLMFIEAKECRKYANYPKSSLKFLLDVINIFVRILSLQRR